VFLAGRRKSDSRFLRAIAWRIADQALRSGGGRGAAGPQRRCQGTKKPGDLRHRAITTAMLIAGRRQRLPKHQRGIVRDAPIQRGMWIAEPLAPRSEPAAGSGDDNRLVPWGWKEHGFGVRKRIDTQTCEGVTFHCHTPCKTPCMATNFPKTRLNVSVSSLPWSIESISIPLNMRDRLWSRLSSATFTPS